MEYMMNDQEILQNLQFISSMTREDVAACICDGENSGTTQALREMFAFAKQELPTSAGEVLFVA